ncbi:hypothetical protein ACIBLA_25555 [Streptomyces sp. NPDC050433]
MDGHLRAEVREQLARHHHGAKRVLPSTSAYFFNSFMASITGR